MYAHIVWDMFQVRSLKSESETARLMELRIRISQVTWKYVCCECSVLSCRWADPSCRGPLPSMSVSLSAIKYNNNPLNVQWVHTGSQTTKKKQRYISDTDNYTSLLRQLSLYWRIIVLPFLVAVVSVEQCILHNKKHPMLKFTKCRLTKTLRVI